MSKTIESLRTNPAKEYILDDQIANTYFRQKAHKKKSKSIAPKRATYLIAAGFLALFSIIIIFLSPSIRSHHINSLKERLANSKMVRLTDGGRANKELVKNIQFRGYAAKSSRSSRRFIILKNPKKYSWADLSLDFKFPIDLSNRKLSFSLKGETGGERLSLVLRDVNNRSSRLSDIYLASGWRTQIISSQDVKEDIDISNITHLRFETGYTGDSSKDMDSPIDFTVYIKDIQISKER